MILPILALGAALLSQAPDQAPQPSSDLARSQAQVPQVVRIAAVSPAVPDEAVPAAEVEEGDAGSALEPVRTRQVCRYIEVTGQRFPVRSCRTVVIEQNER